MHCAAAHRHKPLLLSTCQVFYFNNFDRTIGVTCSSSSHPFLCALVLYMVAGSPVQEQHLHASLSYGSRIVLYGDDTCYPHIPSYVDVSAKGHALTSQVDFRFMTHPHTIGYDTQPHTYWSNCLRNAIIPALCSLFIAC